MRVLVVEDEVRMRGQAADLQEHNAGGGVAVPRTSDEVARLAGPSMPFLAGCTARSTGNAPSSRTRATNFAPCWQYSEASWNLPAVPAAAGRNSRPPSRSQPGRQTASSSWPRRCSSLGTQAANAPRRGQAFDLAEVARGAIRSATPSAGTAGVRLAGSGPKSVPVFGHLERIRQAIDNLIANAVRLSPSGATVTVRHGVDGQFATLAVTDEGPGFASDNVQLQQGDRAARILARPARARRTEPPSPRWWAAVVSLRPPIAARSNPASSVLPRLPESRVAGWRLVDLLRQHEIAESGHRILNPLADEKLMLVGELCRLRPGQRQLDLACGKGEMLCRWSETFQITGLGVDISATFVAAARERAAELRVDRRVEFVEADASIVLRHGDPFDVVSCIGATSIGGGLAGTVELMRPMLKPDGLMLIGEPFWRNEPTVAALDALGVAGEQFVSLAGTLDRFEACGMSLVELVAADADSWDRYIAGQWWTVDRWLTTNPHHADAVHMREYLTRSRRAHLQYGRANLGWAVFVLRPVG
ncbi:MAG: methyltransferase domain-containing protein [Actinomycetota bacterium]|nr:methyltransferase domain-containing protein [Actinomycetota bacterium]